jgi:hypothetical protein
MAVRGVDFLSVTFLVEADRVTGGAKFSKTFGNAGELGAVTRDSAQRERPN